MTKHEIFYKVYIDEYDHEHCNVYTSFFKALKNYAHAKKCGWECSLIKSEQYSDQEVEFLLDDLNINYKL